MWNWGQPEEEEDTLMIFDERKLRMGAVIEKGHEQQSGCVMMIIGHGETNQHGPIVKYVAANVCKLTIPKLA